MQIPLVVDLDRTLISTDVLYESVNSSLSKNPLSSLEMLSWISQSRQVLKHRLAQQEEIEPELLPYNSAVLELITSEKATGRQIVLATASNLTVAELINAHLGLFDVVLGSDENVNLKGTHKSNKLVELFGEKGFDYVGNSTADLEIWQHARIKYFVGTDNKVLRQLKKFSTPIVIDSQKVNQVTSSVQMLRLHQWVKNLLVFIPLIATHRFLVPTDIFLALTAFVIFGIAASAIYIINDLVDLANDRSHPTKKYRPFASGTIPLPVGWVSWPLLLALALYLSLSLLPFDFTLALIAYIFITAAYSFGLKKLAVLDVVILAALYTIRIVAGAYAISAPPSYWILTFSLFFFLSLALMKRFSELHDARKSNREGLLGGRGYGPQDLELVFVFGVSAAVISVLIFMLYIHDPVIAALYTSPLILWLTGPLLLLWILRAWLIAHRGEMHVDPIVFAIRDKTSYVIAAGLAVIFLAAMVF